MKEILRFVYDGSKTLTAMQVVGIHEVFRAWRDRNTIAVAYAPFPVKSQGDFTGKGGATREGE